jgi:hypothetical protein
MDMTKQTTATTPCGGCGEGNPDKRCVGCAHVFTPSEAVKLELSPLKALSDFVQRTTRWQEGGTDRHSALLAIRELTKQAIDMDLAVSRQLDKLSQRNYELRMQNASLVSADLRPDPGAVPVPQPAVSAEGLFKALVESHGAEFVAEVAAILESPPRLSDKVMIGAFYRHKRTRGIYTAHAVAKMKSDNGEWQDCIVYFCEDDSSWYARDVERFIENFERCGPPRPARPKLTPEEDEAQARREWPVPGEAFTIYAAGIGEGDDFELVMIEPPHLVKNVCDGFSSSRMCDESFGDDLPKEQGLWKFEVKFFSEYHVDWESSHRDDDYGFEIITKEKL